MIDITHNQLLDQQKLETPANWDQTYSSTTEFFISLIQRPYSNRNHGIKDLKEAKNYEAREDGGFLPEKKKLRKNEIGLIIEIDKGKLLEILNKRQIHIQSPNDNQTLNSDTK